MFVNAMRDMALERFERNRAVAVVFRLRLWLVAGVATRHGRMLGDFLGKVAPGAFDRLRLTGARLDEMRLDVERFQEAGNVVLIDLEAVAGLCPARNHLARKGAAVVHVDVIGQHPVVVLDHRADAGADGLPCLGLGKRPGEHLAGIDILNTDQDHAHRRCRPRCPHKQVELVTVGVDDLHGMQMSYGALLRREKLLCLILAFAGDDLGGLRHFRVEAAAQGTLRRDR
ncbi:hypothetical protein D3C80_1136480 [compost metagenome]